MVVVLNEMGIDIIYDGHWAMIGEESPKFRTTGIETESMSAAHIIIFKILVSPEKQRAKDS